MFRLESQQNPLAMLIAGAGNQLIQNQLNQQAEQKKAQNVEKALSGLNADSSPMDWFRAINRAPEDLREGMTKLYDVISQREQKAEKAAQEKTTAAEKAKKEKLEVQALRKSAAGEPTTPEEDEAITPASQRHINTQASKSPRLSEQPIAPDQLKRIEEVRNQPGFQDLDEVGQYQALTKAGVSAEHAKRESELKSKQLERASSNVEKSYKEQKDFIDNVTNQHQSFETETKPRLLQMQKLNDKELIGPSAAAFLERFGIPLGALDNPNNEAFQKLSQDLLKGLPDTYGTRILKVEVENYLKTIPTLLNSANGRRIITSNLLKLGEIKDIFYKEMRNQQRQNLDQNKPFPKDFQQRVLDNVLPQMNKFNNEFLQMTELNDGSIPPGHVPFFNPQGTISFIPNDPAIIQKAEQSGGKRIW